MLALLRARTPVSEPIRATSCGHASPHAVWAARTGSKVPKVAVWALPIPVVNAVAKKKKG